jgi:hypothetical protein
LSCRNHRALVAATERPSGQRRSGHRIRQPDPGHPIRHRLRHRPARPEGDHEDRTDETGHSWTRHWATIDGSIQLAAAPHTAQQAPRVQFQNIIYDGLLGADYLDRYRYTIDFDQARMFLEGGH